MPPIDLTQPTVLQYAFGEESDALEATAVSGSDQTTDTTPSQQFGFPDLFSTSPESDPDAQLVARSQINGILNYISNICRWATVGGQYGFDSTFATSGITGGYPLNAILFDSTNNILWRNTTANNTASYPSTPVSGNGWVPFGLGDTGNLPDGSIVTTGGGFFTIGYNDGWSTPDIAYNYITYSSGVTEFYILGTCSDILNLYPASGCIGINLYEVLTDLNLPITIIGDAIVKGFNNSGTINPLVTATIGVNIYMSAVAGGSGSFSGTPSPNNNLMVDEFNPFLILCLQDIIGGGLCAEAITVYFQLKS